MPVFHAYVDFTTDASFVYANATEITSDIEMLDIVGRGKNLLKQQAEACTWTAVLKNDTNKYTPSYTSSPIYPNQLPGKQLWAMMAYPADQFSGMAVNDILSGRKPDHDATFAAWSGAPTQWEWTTSGLQSQAAGSCAVLDYGESDCHVGALITAPTWSGGNTSPGIVFRYTDANNYWLAYPASGTINIFKVVTGTPSLVTTASVTWASATAHWLIVELTGRTIRLFQDNLCCASAITDAFNLTATKHGLGSLSGATVGGYIIEAGGYRPVFAGRVDSWTPNFDPTINQCTMIAYDDMQREYICPVLQTAPAAPTYAGDITNTIATAMGVPTYQRAIDKGNLLLIAAAAGQERLLTRDALTEMHQIEGDDCGFYWIDGTGMRHYESYAFRALLSPVKTWYGSRQNNNESDICFFYQQSNYDDGKDRVLNDLLYNYYFMSVVPATPVWTLNNALDTPFIKHGGGTITLCAIGSGDQMANPIAPVATTDFTVNTQSTGGGMNITSSCVGSLTAGFGGNVVSVTLTNNHASLDGYVTFLQLRADKQTNSFVTAARGGDATSQGAFGLQRLQWDTLHIADFMTAQRQVNEMLTLRKDRRAHFAFLMTNATQANLMQILHRTISECVTLVHAPITLNSNFNIERWSIHIPQNGGSYMECTWDLQAVTSGSAWGLWIWDTSKWDSGAVWDY